ncbi:MAG TPA: RseC/MucC family positive regulator of sigma(E) [Bacteroidales bacterium]|nr:RseC/MucC family positive regulator of sigma(E) [Bacteroidales bacterium]
MAEVVNHEGIVKNVNENFVEVSVIAKSACLSCQLKSACSVADVKEKIIKIPGYKINKSFSIGEKVSVEMKESLGIKALLIGYVYPFFLVLAVLILVDVFTNKQGLAGLLSIGSLVPYYLILFLLKNKFKKIFTFSIK